MKIDLPWLRYVVMIEVTGPLLWLGRDRGWQLRGLLARWMKRQFPCESEARCSQCTTKTAAGGCEYETLFFGKGVESNASLAWMLVPPLCARSVYRTGDLLTFEVRLFGALASHDLFLRRFLPALQVGGRLQGMGHWQQFQQGTHGRFEVVGAEVWQSSSWHQVLDARGRVVQEGISPLRGIPMPSERPGESDHRFEFVTPVALLRGGEPVETFSLSEVLFATNRRLMSLGAVERGTPLDEGFKAIAQAARATVTIEEVFGIADLRTETMKEKRYKAADVYRIGHFIVRDVPEAAWPLIAAASLLHIGKGTRQGCGALVVSPV
jgi:hypothetical protein